MKLCIPKHDFCFTFPWALLVGALGIAGYVAKRSTPSLISGLVIASALMMSGVASLNAWSAGRSSAPWTASGAATTAALTYVMGKKYAVAHAVYPAGILFFGGLFMLAFYAKNMLSGGNPRKDTKKE